MIKRTLIVFFFTLALASCFAQSKEKRVSLNIKQMALGDVFKEITKQTGIPVSYSVSQVPVDVMIDVKVRNKPAEQVLYDICKPLGLKVTFVENQYVIKPDKQNTNPQPDGKGEQPKATISGYVQDATSLEAIPGATVYSSDLRYGTTTNGYGFYSLTIPLGKYRVFSSFMGYKNDSLELSLTGNIRHNFTMMIDEIMLKPIEITVVEDSNSFVVANKLGVDEPSPSKLAKMPVFFSEPDVIKAMQFIPGIKNTVDGSSYYYVRGGERDQNLILLDDAPLFNPSHLFGFFTCINPETLTEIKLHKSDFPSYVGGKLSSVLELRTKEGNRNKFGMSGEWGLLTSRISLEGPMFKKKSSFYISARSSHIQAIAKSQMPNLVNFSFSDLHVKNNILINSKNRLYFSFFGGQDKFIQKNGDDRMGIQWGNFLTSIRWNKIWNEKIFSNTILYVSIYSYDLYQSYENGTRWNSMIATSGLKNDYTFYVSPEVTHHFGFQASGNNYNPGIVLTNLETSPFDIPQIKSLTTGELNLYFSTSRELSTLWQIRYGIRLTRFSNHGPAQYYLFDENFQLEDSIIVEDYGRYNVFRRLDPSFTMTRLFSENQSVKINYFRAHQYHQVLSNSISPFTSIEVWYPSTLNVLPQVSDQFSAGWFRFLPSVDVNVSCEVFYKYMRNQFDYENQASLFLNPYIESELRFGHTHAGGFEIMLRKETGRLQGWVGYAFTRAVRFTEGVNDNRTYLALSDRPVDVSVFLRWQPGQRWLYTLGMIYATGMPYTTPTGYFDYQGYKVPVYSRKNNSRMPDYFRTDVSAQYMLNKKERKFKHYLTFSIYNITASKNPALIYFNKIIDEDGKFVVPYDYAADNSLQPSQMILLGFIPSFKYNFHF